MSYFGDAISSTGQMKQALANLKGAAATAAAPIIEVLTPALTALTNAAATAFSYLSRLISFFTGKSVSAMASAAKGIQKTAATAKKATASLAGFDEIERLGSNSESSGGSDNTVAPNYDFQGQSPFLDSIMQTIKAGQWGQLGQLLSEKLSSALSSIPWGAIQEKAKSIADSIGSFINGALAAPEVWDSIGTTIGEGINTISAFVGQLATKIDWKGIGSSIASGLNNLFATIDWTQAGKSLSDGIKGILTTIVTVLKETDWQMLGNKVAEYLAAIDWNGIASLLMEGIGAALGALAAFLWGLIEEAWNSVVAWWEEVAYEDGKFTMEGLLKGILEVWRNTRQWVRENIFKPFIEGFKEAFGIHSPSTVMAEQGRFLISGLFNGLKSAWNSIPNFFTNAFQSVKKAIVSIWQDGILPAIKGPINSIISCINGMISGIVTGINAVIRSLNKLSFKIPDWVPGLGGESFGFNIGYVSASKIPMLAKGGVITQPTLAMMGEYAGARGNPEIVTPQSVMAETVAAVMQDVTASNIAGFEAVVAILREILEAILGIEIGDDVIGQAVQRYNRKMAIVKGGR